MHTTCLLTGVMLSSGRMRCCPGGWYCLGWGWCLGGGVLVLFMKWHYNIPLPCGQTDRYKNIALPQTSFACGKNKGQTSNTIFAFAFAFTRSEHSFAMITIWHVSITNRYTYMWNVHCLHNTWIKNIYKWPKKSSLCDLSKPWPWDDLGLLAQPHWTHFVKTDVRFLVAILLKQGATYLVCLACVFV